MLRKKNIKLNGKRANPDDRIVEGDIIHIYLSDETIEKFVATERVIKSKLIPNIVYEYEYNIDEQKGGYTITRDRWRI